MELRGQVADALPEAWSITRQDTPALDLRAAITSQLAKAGVGEVTHDTRCTTGLSTAAETRTRACNSVRPANPSMNSRSVACNPSSSRLGGWSR